MRLLNVSWIFLLVMGFSLVGVGQTKVRIGTPESVLVILPEDTFTFQSKKIGPLDNSETSLVYACDFERVINAAKIIAWKRGANVLKVNQLKFPDAWSECYRLKADLLLSPDTSLIQQRLQTKDSLINASYYPDAADYAIIRFYRPSGYGALVGYNITRLDQVLFRMTNRSVNTYRTFDKGPVRFIASTEATEEITLDVEPGKVYYIKCTIGMGVFLGRPQFKLVDAKVGRLEYQKILKDLEWK